MFKERIISLLLPNRTSIGGNDNRFCVPLCPNSKHESFQCFFKNPWKIINCNVFNVFLAVLVIDTNAFRNRDLTNAVHMSKYVNIVIIFHSQCIQLFLLSLDFHGLKVYSLFNDRIQRLIKTKLTIRKYSYS